MQIGHLLLKKELLVQHLLLHLLLLHRLECLMLRDKQC